VIGAHTALRDLERENGVQHPKLRARLGDALVAIRRDLGTDTPLNAAHELERLLLPATQTASAAAGVPRETKLRTVPAAN
jgi:hypothetical protein